MLHQSGGLGLFPYLRTKHTSREAAGQIYLPAANWVLAAGTLLVVAVFRDSERLSSAYGVAVSATFLVTVTLYLLLQRSRHPHSTVRLLVPLAFLAVVLVFFAATLPKVLTGGWAPVTIGALVLVVMTTWWGGRRRLREAAAAEETTPEDVIAEITSSEGNRERLEGSAVFLTQDRHIAPMALCTMVELGYPLPEHVVLLSWHVEDKPGSPADRANVTVDSFEDRYEGVRAVEVTLGYRERLDVTHVLEDAIADEPEALEHIDPATARYFVSEPIPLLNAGNGMAVWRQRLFRLIDRVSTDRVEHLRLPRDRTIVIGRELEL